MQRKFLFLAVGLVLLGVMSRLVPHPANFTALGALAIWSTTLFRSKSLAFLVPISALILSDLVLGFHSLMLWVYGTFLLITILSIWLEPKTSWARAGVGSLLASLLFFVVTNFAVWMSGEIYPLTLQGLSNCYVMAIPFLKNQVAGDLFYTFLLGTAVRAMASRRDLSRAAITRSHLSAQA